MNSDDALQESNEDRDTDRSPTEANAVLSYNVNSWLHLYVYIYNVCQRRHKCIHIRTKISKSLREIRKSYRNKNE